MTDIKQMVSGGKKARFQYFRRGQLWYVTECGFLFAVPVDDVGDATFNAEEGAMLMMRYIRKQIAANEQGKLGVEVREDDHGDAEIGDGGLAI